MNNKITWDTSKEPFEYPDIIKKIYFRSCLKNREAFTKWVGDISKKFSKDIDWWITLPASRNPYTSNLFHYICILKTLEFLSKKRYGKILIIVNSKQLLNVIENWLKRENLDFEIKYLEKNKLGKNYFFILKSIIFTFFLFFWIKFFVKKNMPDERIKNIVLIDTFATEASLYCERHYYGLDNFFYKKKIRNIFFVPTFVIQFNILKIIKIINAIKKRRYLFKEHHLKLQDIFFACLYFARTKKFMQKFKRYENWDLTTVILHEIKSSKDYYAKIISLLNYRFAKNLSEENFPLCKTINWFENQVVDKGWNFGFRKYFNKIKIYGYRGFPSFGQYMNAIPSGYEDSAKVIPKEIIVIGQAYVKSQKEFFKKLKIVIGPALSYQDLFKKFRIKKTIKVLVILNGIKTIDLKLLDWLKAICISIKNMKIYVKPHSMFTIDQIKNEREFPNNIIFLEEKFSKIMKKTQFVVCSGVTSATIESIAYGCFLLVPVFDACDLINMKSINIPRKNYSLVHNENELKNILLNLLKNKKTLKKNKISSDFKNYLFSKVNENNLKYFY